MLHCTRDASAQLLHASLHGLPALQAVQGLARRLAQAATQDPPELLVGPQGRYQPYCQQVISARLNHAATSALSIIRLLQSRDTPAIAAQIGKRYYCSLKEVRPGGGWGVACAGWVACVHLGAGHVCQAAGHALQRTTSSLSPAAPPCCCPTPPGLLLPLAAACRAGGQGGGWGALPPGGP